MEEKTKDLPQVAKDLYLHAVVIHKPVRLGEARELSQQIIKDKDKTSTEKLRTVFVLEISLRTSFLRLLLKK